MISQIILILVVAIAAYHYLNKRKWKLPPGPPGIPGLGNIFTVAKTPHVAHSQLKEKYGDIYYFTLGTTRAVCLGNVQLIKECFNDPNYNGRAKEMLTCILSQGQHGIIASEGQEWVEQRRFTLRHLRDFGFGKNLMENLIMEELDDFARPSLAGILSLLAPSLLHMAPELTGWNHFKRIGDQFHDDGVRSLLAVIGDLFFAGAETSSATLAWSVLYLAINPDIQKKLQDQIDEVVGKSRQVTLADRSNLPYAEATLQEIFRKSSLVVTGVMHTAGKDTTFAGYDIPKGTWMMANIYAIHHDAKLWGDPGNFRPERFLSTDGKKVIKSENVLPFSLGKRICLGENLARDEIFLFLTNIFQRFSISVDPTQPKPDYEPKVGFLLHPKDYQIIVQERA
ncbi:unnamed protein product [Allacma fusca]|uniref:Cytochrome P450 n=2 Tax=Allacma fusca TaxID=39272 RepID=A0A8J2K0X2_9HEXA|nr:unnamed protein product [Allacma fusca]